MVESFKYRCFTWGKLNNIPVIGGFVFKYLVHYFSPLTGVLPPFRVTQIVQNGTTFMHKRRLYFDQCAPIQRAPTLNRKPIFIVLPRNGLMVQFHNSALSLAIMRYVHQFPNHHASNNQFDALFHGE